MKRRDFFILSSLLPLMGFGKTLASLSPAKENSKIRNKLNKDINGILDLHPSLQYKLISNQGTEMSDGFKVPALADGMGAFLVGENIVLIRNHELIPSDGMHRSAFQDPSSQIKKLGNKHYDKDSIGGTTSIILNQTSKEVVSEYLSLSGTRNNCAGGITPWNTWLSCEEDISKKRKNKIPHGYVFEVDPKKRGLEKPVPLKAMGRFNHEAVAFDKFYHAYLTEDRKDGLIYKFIPHNYNSLLSGELYALNIEGFKDSRNWKNSTIAQNKRYIANWVRINDNDPIKDTMRHEGMKNGATPFARPEGIVRSNDSIYICCTTGGVLKKGQIWKLTPITSKRSIIELWYEVIDEKSINMPDNLTVAPWGDLIVCEDNSDLNRLWGINPLGKPYLIAENNYTGSEFAGVCFSPVDNTMFVNLQSNGMTLAIDGRWRDLII